MSDNNNRSSYDPNVVIKAANDKLASNDVNGGQTLFQSALLNWVDDAREQFGGDASDSMREAIATLWVAYAHFLMEAKQFKSATEAYEQAVACPVAGRVGRIWLEYARFLEERNKLRTAQQVYLRALHTNSGNSSGEAFAGVQDEQDRGLLWNEFLEMMRKKNPDLTLRELQQAIQEEHMTINSATAAPDTVASLSSSTAAEQVSKRPRLNSDPVDGAIKQEDQQQDRMTVVSRTHVVTAADVDFELQALQTSLDPSLDPDWKATWMVRDGDAPPQPPTTLLFSAAPPKLSDPTGKDLLGEELALHLIQRLLQTDGAVVLTVAKGMWMLTALKERSSHKALIKLDAAIREEWQQLEARLDERLSVAGAAEAAVRQMNDTERHTFQANCNQQRVQLVSTMAWEFRQLLWTQQQVFLKLQIPGFVLDEQHNNNYNYVEEAALQFQARVCSYLHSAFFLRQRIGEDAHISMLKSQQARLQQLMVKQQQQQQQQENANSTNATTTTTSSTSTSNTTTNRFTSPTSRGPPPPPPPMSMSMQQQQQYPQAGAYGGGPPPPPPPPQGYNTTSYPGQQQQQQQQQSMMMPPPYSQQQNPPYYQQ